MKNLSPLFFLVILLKINIINVTALLSSMKIQSDSPNKRITGVYTIGDRQQNEIGASSNADSQDGGNFSVMQNNPFFLRVDDFFSAKMKIFTQNRHLCNTVFFSLDAPGASIYPPYFTMTVRYISAHNRPYPACDNAVSIQLIDTDEQFLITDRKIYFGEFLQHEFKIHLYKPYDALLKIVVSPR